MHRFNKSFQKMHNRPSLPPPASSHGMTVAIERENQLIKWELIDSAQVPSSDSTMRLMQRGAEMVIWVDGRELMSNRMHGSEDALADLACDHLEKKGPLRNDTRILIGGMGIGFTLAAALRRVGPDATVVVAELVPAVVQWNRGDLGATAGHPVEDPRTSVHLGDVAELIRTPPYPFDAILLDVDNGPHGLTKTSNDWLYGWEGLTASMNAIHPDGVLAVWSAAPDDAFTQRLKRVGFKATPVPVRARGEKGGKQHIIWICTP